ncbi:DUF4249 domain-containing protein [Arundinibacter roseus]|uniref:DUF4249 domain-containing protein n=1 Tax=Arundinibacter roseus TaxID=2070510 RepID=A0A4R4KIP5_9BACT|nr:DUF4249 domain-containing protein [Arundinibacter roseus]TDB68094.1 DUF4249 domain-containing protein [Arundinibacter roseus]
MTRYSLLLMLLVLGNMACDTLVNTIPESELPKTTSQLTLFSFISPQDTLIRVKVSQTRPLFGEVLTGSNLMIINGDTIYTGDALPKASVQISDGKTSAALTYVPQEELFAISTKQFPILAGKTYTLTVAEGNRRAEASCTIPENAVTIQKYTLDTLVVSNFGLRDSTLSLSFTWQDPGQQTNYYRVKAYELVEFSIVGFDDKNQSITESRQVGKFYFSWTGIANRTVLQSDGQLDGTVFLSPQGRKKLEVAQTFGFLNGSPITPKKPPVSFGISLLLLNTDAPYYLFHKSVQDARQDNPFSEPSLVYSNVTNGLGVFAGFNQSTLWIPSREK